MAKVSKRLKSKIDSILSLLDEHFGNEDKCYLHYTTPYELLIATILSAQCTDERVNKVTATLFKKYPTLEAVAEADLAEFAEDILSTGFYHNKARNILSAARVLLREYNGVLPSDIDKLTALPGVGRKTANVIRTHIFHLPSIVVDTHVKRISHRWGITKSLDPVKAEYELMELLPKEHWGRYNTQVIAVGRTICTSQRPKCEGCMFSPHCDEYHKAR